MPPRSISRSAVTRSSYHQTPSGGSTDEEGISQWALEDSVTPGIYSLDDYDFRKPNAAVPSAAEPSLAETGQH